MNILKTGAERRRPRRIAQDDTLLATFIRKQKYIEKPPDITQLIKAYTEIVNKKYLKK